jgi:hypothetical protein
MLVFIVIKIFFKTGLGFEISAPVIMTLILYIGLGFIFGKTVPEKVSNLVNSLRDDDAGSVKSS